MTKKSNTHLLSALILLALFWILPANKAAMAREMTEYPRVKLQSLDKATARTETFEADVGSTLKFGPLYMKVQTCQKSSPIDQPESAAFLQIWEITPQDESQWVFSGWMFASSPGLSTMEHPIYDVWVIDCLDNPKPEAETETEAEAEAEEKDQTPPTDTAE